MIADRASRWTGFQVRNAGSAAAGVALLCLVAAGAAAQPVSAPPCALRNDFIRLMAHSYDEKPVAIGVTDDGRLLEVFASKSGSTWSLAVTLPSGVTCLVMSGFEWHTRPEVAGAGA